jgi:hypothetical protein
LRGKEEVAYVTEGSDLLMGAVEALSPDEPGEAQQVWDTFVAVAHRDEMPGNL